MSDEDDNDAGGAPAGEADADTIARATEMGWVSPDNWKGTPPKAGFLDPAEFVRRGEKVMPLINARAKKAEAELAELRTELAATRVDHRAKLDRIERMSRTSLERQREQMTAEYEAKKEYAVETGDKAAYALAAKQEKEATKAFDDRVAEVEKPKPKAGADAPAMSKETKDTIDAWLTDNPWFNEDHELNAIANIQHQKLRKEKPGQKLEDNLAEVRKYVAKRFPDKFGGKDDDDEEEEAPPVRSSRVEGSSRTGGGRQSQWSRVPPENRQIAERAGHIALYLEKGETMEKNALQARERWAAKYWESEA